MNCYSKLHYQFQHIAPSNLLFFDLFQLASNPSTLLKFDFYQNQKQKELIENSIKEIEGKYKKKVVTYVRKFEKFYKAEAFHQDYYQINFVNYLRYKKACKREEILNNIWYQ